MLISVLLFVLGLIMLIKGGDWFVDGATGIAHRLKMPDILIGATVVSIGTTLPEVMVSATSAVTGHSELAYGNAIGSIICNTALILAVTIAVRPSKVDRKSFLTPIIFFFIAAAFYVFNAYVFGYFSRVTGIVLLALFFIYIFKIVKQVKSGLKNTNEIPEAKQAEALPEKSENSAAKDVLLLVVGAALIAIGARLLVSNGTIIARSLGVPESVIALTIVALGTSLPELITAINSLRKGHSGLALGNVIGANLFNLVLVAGLATTLSPFALPASKTVGGLNASLVIDTPVMLFVMLFLALPAIIRQKVSRVQGIVLLAVYGAFLIVQFIL